MRADPPAERFACPSSLKAVTSRAATADVGLRPLTAAVSEPGRALAITALAGAGIALQSYLNGRLGGHLGSVEMASAVNNCVGLVALGILFGASGEARRVRARLAAGVRPRAWMLAGGLLGAVLVFTTAKAAPELGVALLTVGLVAGQTGGSLPVDAVGLSPAGRHEVNAPRLAGVALAVAAVGVSALGASAQMNAGLLVLAVFAGGAAAVQQATNGQLARAVASPTAAAVVNFALGFVALGALALATTGVMPPNGWGAPAVDFAGGLLGAFFVLVSAAAVRSLGVLRLMLASVAGQSAGALAIDLVAPVPGETVGVATVAGVVLAVVAVGVSGRSRVASSRA